MKFPLPLGQLGRLVSCHLNMAQSATSKQSPFCNRVFVRLGNHLKHCPERQGQEYDHLLSQKTIQKRVVKRRRTPCPKCGKMFERLDTHLHNSVTCQSFQPCPEAQPQPSISPSDQEELLCPSTSVSPPQVMPTNHNTPLRLCTFFQM